MKPSSTIDGELAPPESSECHLEGVAVILLNWNGLDNTLECIQSLLEQEYPNFRIFVLDNGSLEDPEAAIGIFRARRL